MPAGTECVFEKGMRATQPSLQAIWLGLPERFKTASGGRRPSVVQAQRELRLANFSFKSTPLVIQFQKLDLTKLDGVAFGLQRDCS